MSLEVLGNLDQKKKEVVLTPEMIESLERGYELEVEHLRKNNISNLEKADEILSPEQRKEIIKQLGDISVEAADANGELLKELRKQGKLN